MKSFIIGLICVISPFLSFGHNPLSARYHLEAGKNASVLTINLSQDGVNKVLINKYGKEKLEAINQNEFKELIVGYIKDNFNLSIDKQEIHLEKGGIKLGNHQTDLKFLLPPISTQVEKLVINIPAFKESHNHQTIFSYNMKGETKHIILSQKNNYQSTIFVSAIPTTGNSNNWIGISMISILCIILVIIVSKIRLHTNKLSFVKAD